ncbi:MAG TPA: GNAT family N-acetyltransferase [Gemmatimonadales bacterium]|nr:GNAT family N-acetyltransferase [Gemmatimonadales bacterium]
MEWLHYVPGKPEQRLRNEVAIVPYERKYRDAFRELNEEWLNFYMEVEPEDARVLGDPEGTILANGGVIILAVADGRPVGSGALINEGNGKFELAKMAVTESYRGRGIGQRIAERLITIARSAGAREVELVSARLLPAATPLYRKLGFREIPLGENPYARADIRMTLELTH